MITNNLMQDIHLIGEHVELVAMKPEHHDALIEAASDGQLWTISVTNVPSPESMLSAIDEALNQRMLMDQYPFVVIHKASGRVIGSTRYYEINRDVPRLAIGYTWYAKSHWRTAVNTECKFLLLRFAFEELGCLAVAFHTHINNQRSRVAISRIGAQQEGIIRHERRMANGSLRDTVCFSIIDEEWPRVQQDLLARLRSTP